MNNDDGFVMNAINDRVLVLRLIFFFLLIFSFSNAQITDYQRFEVLSGKVVEYRSLLMGNPEKGIVVNRNLLKEAVAINDHDTELLLLSHQCWYNMYKVDFDNSLKSADYLEKKSLEYGNKRFQAVAYTYKLNAFGHNQLRNEALEIFDKAIAILEKEDQSDVKVIETKNNAYTYLSNMYLTAKQPREAISVSFKAIKDLQNVRDPEKKAQFLYRKYSHLGAAYVIFNLDSAKYFVHKSMELKPKHFPENDDVTILNYSLLGDIEKGKKNFSKSIEHYKEVEKLIPKDYDIMNQRELYKGFAESYESLKDYVNAGKYQSKLQNIELKISENKNKSLHQIIKEKEETKKAGATFYFGYIILSGLLLLILLVFVFRLYKKNKILSDQENRSKEYLQSNIDIQPNREEQHKKLITLLKNNSSDFFMEFQKVFPNFSQALMLINSSIVESEIEFCSYLKLNLTTKDIAVYKDLLPKTVQNKKYRIRKKLNIPDNIDIYFFFSQI